ncbi:MAG: class I SAM-dependent methyltransferase [Actinomycetota bacterium]|nr:class I SAM-dependent methyltransferase [Actinomycetota bacterium]
MPPALAEQPLDGLLEILRCPSTGQQLKVAGDELVTVDGERSYRFAANGGPVLLVSGVSLFAENGTGATSTSSAARLRQVLRRTLTASPVSRENFELLAALLREGWHDGSPPRRVLVVGGGTLGFGAEALAAAPWIDLIETDVYLGPRTRIVCDGHDLPFVDGAFAGVVCQAVLEHVADPQRVAQELHRVLAPGGLVYSEVPFMQQVHEGAYDFTRWTMTGHRRLLRQFDEIETGAVGGPGEALAWSLRHFVLALAGRSPLRRSFDLLTQIATLPLRWLDHWLRGRPAGLDAASGTFILGRRRPTPLSDLEIVAAHRGAVGTPSR